MNFGGRTWQNREGGAGRRRSIVARLGSPIPFEESGKSQYSIYALWQWTPLLPRQNAAEMTSLPGFTATLAERRWQVWMGAVTALMVRHNPLQPA